MSGMDENARVSDWIAFLEMPRKPDGWPALKEGFAVALAAKDWRINREWYRRVGGDWAWTDRLKRTEAQWREYVDSESLETWIAEFEAEECGYFEIFRDGCEARIALLGLDPKFIGKGLGASLLIAALREAWAEGTENLTLDTCSKDHPNALPNYLRHGFRIIRTEFADEFGMG